MLRLQRTVGISLAAIVRPSSGVQIGPARVYRRTLSLAVDPENTNVVDAGSASGGANQTQVGMAVTQATRGRYESIAAASRLATLLPEIGKQVAASVQKQSHQFRLTVERPAGAKGDVGQVGAGARSGLVVQGLSMDGRLP